jgi:hypothetical protein
VFLPHYLPYNEAAKLLTYEIARELHLSLSGKTGQKVLSDKRAQASVLI